MYTQIYQDIDLALQKSSYSEAELLCQDVIGKCLKGLYYFQTYDHLFLNALIILGYVSCNSIIDHHPCY